MSQRAPFALGIILIAVFSVSIIATIDWLGSAHSIPEFFVGVEFAYDENSARAQMVWDDANTLIDQYGSRLDIVYSDPEVMDAVKSRYDKLFFWNQTF